MKNTKLGLLAILLLLTIIACNTSKSVSTVSIPPLQQFVLGESEDEAFKVNIENLTNQEISIEVRNGLNQKTSGFGMSPKGKTDFTIDADEKVVVKNPSSKQIFFKATFNRNVQGMRYETVEEVDLIEKLKLTEEDLKKFVGNNWKGTLMYVDYSSGKEVFIPCEMKVEETKNGGLTMNYIYPEEPEMNSSIEAGLENNNRWFEGRQIVSVDRNKDYLEFVSVMEEDADDEEIFYYFTYKITNDQMSIKREYQEAGNSDIKLRNQYTFTRE